MFGMDKMKDKESQDVFHGVFNLNDTPKDMPQAKEEKDMSTLFEEERLEWRDKVIAMAMKIKDMKRISELQVELYSNRQIVLERSHYLQSLLAKVNKGYKKSLGAKTNEYMNGDRRLKMGETNILVDASVADIKESIDMISAQIDYMHETKKSIDNMIFGIKDRIQLEDYRRTT